MRPFRILVPMMVWMAAGALPGCRPAEPARAESEIQVPVEPAAVVVDRDTQTIDSSGMIVTVTENTPEDTAARPEEHNDCRYVGSRRQARYGEPGFGERYDPAVMKSGVPFRCRLRPDGPEVKLVLSGEVSIPEFVDVHSPADAPRPMQRLVLDNSEGAYEGSELLVGEDLNGDGWMDLYVFTYSGSAGQMSDVFRYEPSARRFVPDTALPGMNVRRLPGRPRCVGVSHKTSAWDHTGGEYCWQRGTWVKVRAYTQDGLRDGRLVRTEEALRGGRMVVVSVDTGSRYGPGETLPE
jgi:hypothetical protein